MEKNDEAWMGKNKPELHCIEATISERGTASCSVEADSGRKAAALAAWLQEAVPPMNNELVRHI